VAPDSSTIKHALHDPTQNARALEGDANDNDVTSMWKIVVRRTTIWRITALTTVPIAVVAKTVR
jgi:hypothetical protein